MNPGDLTDLPIRQKVGQLFFIGIPGPVLDPETESLLDVVRPGGVCLFARNIREASQTRELLDRITARSEIVPFLSLDQEGGLVDRLRRVVTPMPAADRFRRPADARWFGRTVAEIIRILGFNMNFAPVVDVIDQARAAHANGLHSRAFGRSADEVIELSGAFLDGLEEGGVLGCLKHFPGLGGSQVDSHEELPVVGIDAREMGSTDLLPYKAVLNEHSNASVMVAHAAYPKLDLQEAAQNGKLLPSSLSFNFVTKLLRQEIGFEGVAITDDLEMGAVVKNFGIGEACRMAITAGEDMLAICASPQAIREGFEAVTDAVKSGAISESRLDESVGRIAKLKAKLQAPPVFDAVRLDALSREIAEFKASLN